MAELSDRESAYLARLGRSQPVAAWLGVGLALLGAAYIAWALYLFDYRVDPRTQASFDEPVAELGFLYDRYQKTLDKIIPETQIEGWLLDGLRRGMIFSAGTMVLMLRLYIGTLVCVMGLVALTVVVERRRLLRLVHKLNA